MERLTALALEGRAEPPAELSRRIFGAVSDFTRGVAQYDDQTVLIAARRGARRETPPRAARSWPRSAPSPARSRGRSGPAAPARRGRSRRARELLQRRGAAPARVHPRGLGVPRRLRRRSRSTRVRLDRLLGQVLLERGDFRGAAPRLERALAGHGPRVRPRGARVAPLAGGVLGRRLRRGGPLGARSRSARASACRRAGSSSSSRRPPACLYGGAAAGESARRCPSTSGRPNLSARPRARERAAAGGDGPRLGRVAVAPDGERGGAPRRDASSPGATAVARACTRRRRPDAPRLGSTPCASATSR